MNKLIAHSKWMNEGPHMNAIIAGLPSDVLKVLWDDEALLDGEAGMAMLEAIRTEMNYRGEGAYVAL